MIKKIIIVTLLPLLSCTFVQTAQTTQLVNHKSIDVFASLQMPLTSITDSFTLGIFKEIDNTFGPKGLNLEPIQIQHAKNCYLYLIFTTKLQAANTKPQFKQYQTAFMPFFEDNGTSTPHLPTTELLQSADWQSVIISSQDIQNSLVWQLYCKAMVCDIYAYFSTALKVLDNAEQQEFNYLPHFETSYYNQDYTNLRNLNAITRTKLILEQHACQYYLSQIPAWQKLPHVYATTAPNTKTLESAIVDFRHSPFYQMSHNLAALTGNNSASVTPSSPTNPKSVSLADLMQAPKMTSPLKEFIFCYFMLYEMYGHISSSITTGNLAGSINTLATSTLSPNIMPYNTEDFVLLNALLAQKSKSEGTHTSSIHPSPQTFVPEDLRKPEAMLNPSRDSDQAYMKRTLATATQTPTTQPEVKAQWFWDAIAHWVSHAADSVAHAFTSAADDVAHTAEDVVHDVKTAYSDVKNGVEQAADAVAHIAIAAGTGIAGVACDVAFFVPGATAEADKLTKESQQNFEESATSLDNSINDFKNALESGIDAYAEIEGNLVGFIIQDKAIGNDISSVISSTAGAIVTLAANMASSMGNTVIGFVVTEADLATIAGKLVPLIASSVEAVFSGKTNDFLQAWHSTLNTVVLCATTAYTMGMKYTQSTLAAVMQSIGAVMNSITTLFIDLSREITFIFMTAADATIGGIVDAVTGQTYDPIAYGDAAKSLVYNKLNAHRQVINMSMGVVLCVVADPLITFFTAGSGTAAEPELDAAIMGAAEAAAETATETAGEAASEATDAAANTATSTSSSSSSTTADAGNSTADQGTDADSAAKSNAKDVAKDTAKDAAKQGPKSAAKQMPKELQEAAERAAMKARSGAKSLGERISQAAEEKINSIAKSLRNLTKSSDQIADETEEQAATARTAANEAKAAMKNAAKALRDAVAKGDQAEIDQAETDLANAAKNSKSAEAEAKEAEAAAKEAKGNTNASKLKKAGNVAKGGASMMGAMMNCVFNLTMVISAYNQDSQNILQQEQQEQTLQNLWTANTQSKLSNTQTALAVLEETSAKQQAAIGNNTLGLALYQNYTYAYLNQYRQNILTALAPVYIEQLLPDSTTQLLPADIGTQWGIVSNILNLYPSESFYTTTTGRLDFPFAQEIAQAPQIASQQGKTTINKEWYNQRCIAVDRVSATGKPNLPEDPLHVSLDLQILYTLDSEFYTGIYMGGHFHDYASPTFLASLLNTTPNNISTAFGQLQQALSAGTSTTQYLNPSVIDLNETDLAKMVVLYRSSATDTLKIGVYEALGSPEWILQQELPVSAQLTAQHTYHLDATLQGDSLQISLLIDDNTTPIFTKTVTVTKITNQRMYGIISSGAAITWNQKLPAVSLTTNSTARPPTTQISEIDRDKQARVNQADGMNPSFGSWKLTPLSKQAILCNQYVYASTKTDLQVIDPKNSSDFLIFATNNNGTISNFGKAPNSIKDSATNVLVSLITNHVFDSAGNVIKIVPNCWPTYQSSSYGPLSAKLSSYITSEQQNIQTILSKITFGQFTLNIINPAALAAGTYIYTSLQTIQENNAPVTDYLICTTLPASGSTDIQLGLPPTAPNAQALLSLVTGKLYPKTTTITPKVLPTAQSTYDVFTKFQEFVTSGNVSKADYNTIQAAQLAYVQSQAQQQAAAAQATPLDITKLSSIQPISATQIAPTPAPVAPAPTVAFGFNPPAQNIAVKQQQAAGPVTFQFFAPTPTPATQSKKASFSPTT